MFAETYTNGFTLVSKRNVLKRDFIALCRKLNQHREFINRCTFQPESITEGGIQYRFITSPDQHFYKTIRFHIFENGRTNRTKFPWVTGNVMTE